MIAEDEQGSRKNKTTWRKKAEERSIVPIHTTKYHQIKRQSILCSMQTTNLLDCQLYSNTRILYHHLMQGKGLKMQMHIMTDVCTPALDVTIISCACQKMVSMWPLSGTDSDGSLHCFFTEISNWMKLFWNSLRNHVTSDKSHYYYY